MRTPEQRRTLFNIGFILVTLAAVAFAMTAPGCAGSGGAAPQLNVRQMAADYVKRARLAVSLVKSGDGVCVEFGIADSSGVVFIGTGNTAFVHVDPPCFSVEAIMHAVTRDAAGPPTPKSRIMLPLTVRDSTAVDTTGKGE